MADRSFLQKMFDYLAGTEAGGDYLNNVANATALEQARFNKYGNKKVSKANLAKIKPTKQGVADAKTLLGEHPLAWKTPVAEGANATVSPLKTTGGMLWNNIKAHPWQTAGTALNATGNVAGLVDNDKLLGQILGTAGGALLASKGLQLGPLGVANMAMGGGNLGALFDNLRAKKAQEGQYQQQYS